MNRSIAYASFSKKLPQSFSGDFLQKGAKDELHAIIYRALGARFLFAFKQGGVEDLFHFFLGCGGDEGGAMGGAAADAGEIA